MNWLCVTEILNTITPVPYAYSLGSIGYTSSVDRVTFPFDSGTASIVGNLARTTYGMTAVDGTDFVSLFR